MPWNDEDLLDVKDEADSLIGRIQAYRVSNLIDDSIMLRQAMVDLKVMLNEALK